MASNFIIVGDDTYLRDKEEKKIRDKFLSREEIDLNYAVYPPEDFGKALDDLGTSPFLSEKRVAVIRDYDKLPEEGASSVIKYLEKPSPTGVLVLTSGAEFRKKAAYKKIAGHVTEISADKLTSNKVKAGIRKFFSKEGIEISPDAVDLIFDLKGADASSIINEIEKLAAFSGGERIETEHVERMVGRSVTETVFKLVDALGAGDMKMVFRVLNDLSAQKKQIPEIIGYLAWYIRTIQKIKFLSARGAGMDEMVRSAGKAAYRTAPVARKYTSSKIGKWLEFILEAETDYKKGRKTPALALEMLVVKLSGT